VGVEVGGFQTGFGMRGLIVDQLAPASDNSSTTDSTWVAVGVTMQSEIGALNQR